MPQQFQWTKQTGDVKQSFKWQPAPLVPVFSQKIVPMCPKKLWWEGWECA